MPKPSFPAAGEAMPNARPTIFLALTPAMRLRLATTIEALINLLDEIDGDAELESYLTGHADDEREGDLSDWEPDVDDEDDADCEPELGFVGHGTGWLGEETDDREGDNELEPNLAGSPSDLEHDDADYDCPAFMWGGSEDEVEMRP